jgi:hypothetical protein
MRDITDQEIKTMQKISDTFVEDLLKFMQDSGLPTTPIVMSTLELALSKLLPAAAFHGGVRTNPEYNLDQRVTYMGNRAVANVVEGLQDDPAYQALKRMSEIMR